jgi:hypothetical protein
MMENLKITKNTEKVEKIIRTGVGMKGNLEKIKDKVMDYFNLKMENFTKENYLMENLKEKVYYIILMEDYTRDNGRMVFKMV